MASPSSSCRGILGAAQVKIPDFSRCGIRERTWWHLRHLQEPLLAAAEDGISVVHWLLAPNESSSPGRSRRQRRKKKGSTSGTVQGDLLAGSPSSQQLFSPQDENAASGEAFSLALDSKTQVRHLFSDGIPCSQGLVAENNIVCAALLHL